MKILIVMKNWVGDTLFQLPALEWIHERYPDAEIVCLAPERCRGILDGHPHIGRLIPFDEKTTHRSWFRWLGLALRLRRENWDQAYLFHRSRSRAFLTLLAGARERIGYGAGRRFFLTRPVREPARPMHQVDYFLHMLKEAGLGEPQNGRYHFYAQFADDREAQAILGKHNLKQGRFVCFHLGANWKPKRWPEKHFAKLADLIFERWHLPVVVTGGPGDEALVALMKASVRKARVVSFAGQIGLGVAGAVYTRAALVISGDSGPMHLAAASGTPVVALFGPTDPELTGPRGPGENAVLQYLPEGYSVPWYGDHLPSGGWLSRIQPEEVIQTIEEKGWLEAGRDSRRVVTPKYALNRGCGDFEARSASTVRHILVVTLSNIGDVILTTPVIASLARRFPAAKLTVVSGPKAAGLLRGSRSVHRLVVYDKKAGLGNKWKFLRRLRGVTYDLVVDLRNTAIPYLVRARKRSPLWRPHGEISMRARHLEVLAWMGFPGCRNTEFDFFDAREDRQACEKWPVLRRRPILVAAGAASLQKRWKLEGFREVLAGLLEITDREIILVGDSREARVVHELTGLNPGRIHNLAGKTSLRELAVFVAKCSLLLSNDSAVMHLAHELDRPVIALFGPTDPAKYGRIGPHFRIVRGPDFDERLAGPVLKACRELLFPPGVQERPPFARAAVLSE